MADANRYKDTNVSTSTALVKTTRNRRRSCRSSRSRGQAEHTMSRLIQSRETSDGQLSESLVDHSSATTTVHFRFPLPEINIDIPTDTDLPIHSFKIGSLWGLQLLQLNSYYLYRQECLSRCWASCNSCRFCCCCCCLCATGAAPNCVSIASGRHVAWKPKKPVEGRDEAINRWINQTMWNNSWRIFRVLSVGMWKDWQISRNIYEV